MKYLTIIFTLLFVIACDNGSDTSSDSDDYGYRDIYSADGELISDEEVKTQLEELFDSADCLQAEVPSDTCIGGDLYDFSGDFTLTDNVCNFSFKITKCENGCTDTSVYQEEAHCSNACDNKVCISTGEPTCADDWWLHTFVKGIQGDCIYEKELAFCDYGYENLLEDKSCKNGCIINPDGPDYCE